jgi:Dip2/Utp12 Family
MPPSSSSYPPLVTAVSSPSEGLVAVAHPQQQGPHHTESSLSSSASWRVGLYNVKNGEGYLQTTLTASGSSSQPSISGRIQRLLFWGESSSLLAAVSTRCVVVWDLRRGVVAHTIVPTKKSSSTAAANYSIVDAQVAPVRRTGSSDSAVNGRSLYLLVQHSETSIGEGDANDDDVEDGEGKRSVLWQYDGSQLVRKIKIKGGGAAVMVTSGADALWVSSGRKIRVHSGETGKVLHKLSFASPVRAMAMPSHAAPNVSGAAYVLLESGEIRWVADDGKAEQRVVGATTAAAAADLARAGTSSALGSSWPLLEACGAGVGRDSLLVGGRNVVRVGTNDEEERRSPASPKQLLDMKTADSGVVRCAASGGNSKGREQSFLVAVLYKNGTIQIQSRAADAKADSAAFDEAFVWRDAGELAAAADRNSGKRLASRDDSKGGTPAILGPAQAGGTARHVHEPAMQVDDEGDEAKGDDDQTDSPPSKKSRSDETQNDETIGSRLAQLRAQLLADDEEEARQDAVALSGGTLTATGTGGETVTFQPKKATTESLSQLLKQALQDDALLELCLAVSNPSIIRETVSQLPASDVSSLVAAITSRVAFRPGRAEVLCLWLTVLLQTRKASLEVLQPLQNLINDRIELLPALLKLEGRLSLLSP